MKNNGPDIFVGCSGWSYKHWKDRFYPEDLSPKNWFEFYSETFDTVEINYSFYQLPQEKTFEGWARKAKEGFVYSVKASRYITHIRRLKDVGEPVDNLLKRARLLDVHLGPILYQLPPKFDCDPERFENFLRLLPEDLLHVVEFRDQRWLNDEIFSLMKKYRVNHCVHDKEGLEIPWNITGPIAYVRFHGTTGEDAGNYPDHVLEKWAKWLKDEAEKHSRDIYAYFNNDWEAYAVYNAQSLRRRLVGK